MLPTHDKLPFPYCSAIQTTALEAAKPRREEIDRIAGPAGIGLPNPEIVLRLPETPHTGPSKRPLMVSLMDSDSLALDTLHLPNHSLSLQSPSLLNPGLFRNPKTKPTEPDSRCSATLGKPGPIDELTRSSEAY
jgi:hypothetical protein